MATQQEQIQEITQIIADRLIALSQENNIKLLDLRIKIDCINNNMVYALMDKTVIVRKITLKDALNMKGIFDALKLGVIANYLKKGLSYYANQQGVSLNDLNCRLYTTKESGEPSAFLFNNMQPLKKITIEELLQIK
jgi:hypothetical protein